MKTTKNIFLALTFIFTLLIYDQDLGLNAFLIPLISSIFLYFLQKENISTNWLFAGSLWILSGLSISLWHLDIGTPLFLITTLHFFAINYNPKMSLPLSIIQSLNTLFNGLIRFFRYNLNRPESYNFNLKNKKIVYRILLISIPIVIVLIFLKIYQVANPEFEKLTNFINLDFIEWPFFLVYLLIMLISYGLFFYKPNDKLLSLDLESKNIIEENESEEDIDKLKFEWQLGVTIVALLSLLLIFFIGVDFYSIQNPNSELSHSQNVHQGINILIVSIILVIIIIVLLFKGSLNFSKSNILKYLTIVWLSLNAILIGLIVVKNFNYIANWGLTHKRIGVFIYLALCIVGLLLTGLKTLNKTSTSALIKQVSKVFISILVVYSLFNWNGIIAKYNLNENNLSASKIDFEYLARIGPETYPHLLNYANTHPESEWVKINLLDRNIARLRSLYDAEWTNVFSYKYGSLKSYHYVESYRVVNNYSY